MTACSFPPGSTSYRDRLIEDHLEFARSLTRRLAGRLPAHVDVEELEADAYFGLFKAAGKFDPHRGVDFCSYAAKRIVGEVIDGLRRRNGIFRNQPVVRVQSLDVQIGVCEGRPQTLGDTLVDDGEPVGTRLEALDEADAVLRHLKPASQRHMIDRYLHGHTQTHIARSLGISQAGASQRMRQIRYEIAQVRCCRG